MKQVTLRLPEQLAEALRGAAAERDQSVNAYATSVLSAATDPELAGDESERLRLRLARAGLLVKPSPRRAQRPTRAEVEEAGAAAGRGTSLSDLVSEGRR